MLEVCLPNIHISTKLESRLQDWLCSDVYSLVSTGPGMLGRRGAGEEIGERNTKGFGEDTAS